MRMIAPSPSDSVSRARREAKSAWVNGEAAIVVVVSFKSRPLVPPLYISPPPGER